MNKIFSLVFTFFFIHALTTEEKISYWNTQRKGANYFNQKHSANWFFAAKQTGIEFARMSVDKWHGQDRDFLIGDADAFTKISCDDFEKLKTALDNAQQNEIKVVITLLSLPGSRWRQNNHNQDDLRLWENAEFRQQAILFWKNLAQLLKDHPAVVGYNILNEPHPERLFNISDFRQLNFEEWHKTIANSLVDLNLFYKEMVKAIREVDSSTPIVVDTGLYATPWAINYLIPLDDDKVIYSFHMYEPYNYTTRKINNGHFTYPGNIPLLEDSRFWNAAYLEQFLQPVVLWQKKYEIPSSRILVGEFGCDRTANGAKEYLSDLITLFNANHWHWAFYSFREDCWDGMDYELGPEKLSWEYWEAVEQGTNLDKFRKDNPLFEVIKKELLNKVNHENHVPH